MNIHPEAEDVWSRGFPIRAMGKPRMTKSDKWRKRQPVKDWFAYKDHLLSLLEPGFYDRLQRATIYQFRVEATIAFPKSYSKAAKQVLLDQPHRVKPDASNILKGIEDILVESDQELADVACSKSWGNEDWLSITITFTDGETDATGERETPGSKDCSDAHSDPFD